MKLENLKFCRLAGQWRVLQEPSLIAQISRFTLVGILNTFIGFGTFIIFLGSFNYLYSLILSHIVGVANSYVWNKYWTFGSKRVYVDEFIKFYFIYFILLLFNAIGLVFLVQIIKLDPKISQLIILPIITLISFTSHRNWSFNGNEILPWRH